MRSMFLLAAAFIFGSAHAVEVYGVTLGEQIALPECGKNIAQTAEVPDGYHSCIESRYPGDAHVVFDADTCPMSYLFECGFQVVLNERKEVVGLEIGTSGSGAEEGALRALIPKFGKPNSEHAERLQNGFGAKFVNHTYRWVKPGYVVEYVELNGSTAEGLISIRTPESMRIERARKPSPATM